jgi:hypothetical protein
MWVQGIASAVAWHGLTAEADDLWAALARSSAQRYKQLRQAQGKLRDVDVRVLAEALDCPAVFANTQAADVYRVQLSQMFARAQQQWDELEHRVRTYVSQLHLSDYRLQLPRVSGPDLSQQPALLTVYVARYHAYLQQYQAALGQPESPKPIHQAWLQWAAVAAVIDVVAGWVNLAAPMASRARHLASAALWAPCPAAAVPNAPMRAVCLNPLLC